MRFCKGIALAIAALMLLACPAMAEEDVLAKMMALDTGMTVAAYNEQLVQLSEAADMTVYEPGNDLLDKLALDDPLYRYMTGILANSQQELFGEPFVDCAVFKMETNTQEEAEISAQLRGQGKPPWLLFMLEHVEDLRYAAIMSYFLEYEIADPATMTIDAREARFVQAELSVQQYFDDRALETLFADGVADAIQADMDQLGASLSDAAMTIRLTVYGIEVI